LAAISSDIVQSKQRYR